MKMTSEQLRIIRDLIADRQRSWEYDFTSSDLRCEDQLRDMLGVAELHNAILDFEGTNHTPEAPKDRVMTGEELCYFVWTTVAEWANEEYLANGPEVPFEQRYQENAETWIKDLQEFLGVSS